jgi:hypothetical protein
LELEREECEVHRRETVLPFGAEIDRHQPIPPASSVRALSFRPGTVDDARFIADVRTAEFPEDPWDPPALAIGYADPDQVWRRFRSFAGEEAVGFAITHHTPGDVADDGFVWLLAGFLPVQRTQARRPGLSRPFELFRIEANASRREGSSGRGGLPPLARSTGSSTIAGPSSGWS